MLIPEFLPIVDAQVCLERGLSPSAVTRGLLRAGVSSLMLRDKRPSGDDATSYSERADEFCNSVEAELADFSGLLVLNFRANCTPEILARFVSPNTVWHGETPRVVTFAPKLIVRSRSVHDETELRAAEAAGASWILISPVLPTATKPGLARTLGLVRAAELACSTHLPALALGGIQTSHVASVRAAGFRGVAALGTICTVNAEAAAREFLDAFARCAQNDGRTDRAE